MDLEICWRWFNDVLYPSVKQQTSRPVLLILDNAPGHFETLKEIVSAMCFFLPNCTNGKQPCDMGIIAALKKIYKYLYLNDVLSFYDLDAELKEIKKHSGARLRRGAARVDYGNPADLLDIANYVKASWDAITPQTILNCFKKAKIMVLDEHDSNLEIVVEDADVWEAVRGFFGSYLDCRRAR